MEEVQNPSFNYVRLFISNITASRTKRYFDIDTNEYIDEAILQQRVTSKNVPNFTSATFRLYGYKNETERDLATNGLKSVQRNPLALFFSFNYIAKVLANQKFRPYTKDYFQMPGPDGLLPNIPAGLDLDTFQYALRFEGPEGKSSIITDVEARQLHEEEKIREIYNENPKAKGVDFKGIWYYLALSDPKNRNSGLTGKNFVITNRMDWVDENERDAANFLSEYTKWWKTQGIQPSNFVPSKEEQKIAMAAEPAVEQEPAAKPAVMRKQKTQKQRTKVLVVPPKEKEELEQGEIIPPQPIPGGPKIQAAPSSNEYDILGRKSIENYIKFLKAEGTCQTTEKRNALMEKIRIATVWQDKSKNVPPKGKKEGTHLNLIGFRMNLAPNVNKSSNVIGMALGVSGESLFGNTDLGGKPPMVRVIVNADKQNILEWNGSGNRSGNNKEFVNYVTEYFLQGAFDALVAHCLPNEAAEYRKYSVKSTGETKPFYATHDEYMKALDEIVLGDTDVERKTFTVMYPAEENLGFPPGVIAVGVLQQEGNIEMGQLLPNITRPKQLLATLSIDDTKERAEVLEENIREFRIREKQPTTVAELREGLAIPVPANVNPSKEPFEVFKPPQAPKEYVKVDLRIPRPSSNRQELVQDVGEEDEE